MIPNLVWVGFTRIETSLRVFPHPSPPQEAIAFRRRVESAPCVMSSLPAGRWDTFDVIAADAQAAGNAIPDAYLAATAASLGAAVATMDRGLRRYVGVELITPPAENPAEWAVPTKLPGAAQWE